MLALILIESNKFGDEKINKEWFDNLTCSNTIVMGRKTFERIGHPFPNRLNIVISKTNRFSGNNIITVSSLEEALYLATDKAFIINSYSFLESVLPLVDVIYKDGFNIEKEKSFLLGLDEKVLHTKKNN